MKRNPVGIKGSFTVEAALLTPLFLLVVFAVISLHLWVYNRAWYTAAAYETAAAAATEGVSRDGKPREVLQDKIQRIKEGGFVGCTVTATEDLSEDTVIAAFSGEMPWVYGNRKMQFTAKGVCEVIKPVVFIRKARNVGKFLETGRGIAGYE